MAAKCPIRRVTLGFLVIVGVLALLADPGTWAAGRTPIAQSISGSEGALPSPRIDALSLSPDGRRLAFRVAGDPGSQVRSDALWCTTLDKRPAPRRIAEATALVGFSWSSDSSLLLAVKRDMAERRWSSAVWLVDPSGGHRGRQLYQDRFQTIHRASCYPGMPGKWMAVLVGGSDPGSTGVHPVFHVAVIDLERKVRVANWRLNRADVTSAPAWFAQRPQVAFPLWDGDQYKRFAIIALGQAEVKRTIIATARPVFRVYPDARGAQIYYCHPAIGAYAQSAAEGLSVVDLRTKAERVIVTALKYKQVAVSPDGRDLAYISTFFAGHPTIAIR